MIYDERVSKKLKIVLCYVETNGTVRKVAKQLGVSKTNVHRILTEFIQSSHASEYERNLAIKVKAIIEKNKQERHWRGASSTQQKFKKLKDSKENNVN